MINAYAYAASFANTLPPPAFEFYSTDFEAPAFEDGNAIGQDGWTVGETGDDGFATIVLAGQNNVPASPSGGQHLLETFAWEGDAMSTRRSLGVLGGATSVWAPFSAEIVAAYDRADPEQRFEINRGRGGGVTFGFSGSDIVYESDGGTQVLAAGVTAVDTFYRFEAEVRPGPAMPWDATGSSGHFELRVYDMADQLVGEVEGVKAAAFVDSPVGGGYAYFYIQNYQSANNAATLTDSVTFEAIPLEFLTFAEWRAANFPGEAENDEVSGPAANPSGDGVANLVKYFLNLDPSETNRSLLPEPVTMDVEVGGQTDNYLTISFTHNDPSEAGYTVKAGSDLGDLGGSAVLVSATENGDGTVTKLYRSPDPISEGDRDFLQLEVSLP